MLSATAPLAVKKFVWHCKYRAGYFREAVAPHEAVDLLVSRPASSILDLGCGRGSLLRGLRQRKWQGEFCGADISPSAIQAARDEFPSAQWHVSGIEGFQTERSYDAIALLESVYYVHPEKLSDTLIRLRSVARKYLLLRVCDFMRHRECVDTILKALPDAEIDGKMIVASGRA